MNSDYTELSLDDRIAELRAMIRNLESQQHQLDANVRANLRISTSHGNPKARQVAAQQARVFRDQHEGNRIALEQLREDLADAQALAAAELPADPAPEEDAGPAADDAGPMAEIRMGRGTGSIRGADADGLPLDLPIVRPAVPISNGRKRAPVAVE